MHFGASPLCSRPEDELRPDDFPHLIFFREETQEVGGLAEGGKYKKATNQLSTETVLFHRRRVTSSRCFVCRDRPLPATVQPSDEEGYS